MKKFQEWSLGVRIAALVLAISVAAAALGCGIFSVAWWASGVHHRLTKIEDSIVVLDGKMDTLLNVNGVKVAEQ